MNFQIPLSQKYKPRMWVVKKVSRFHEKFLFVKIINSFDFNFLQSTLCQVMANRFPSHITNEFSTHQILHYCSLVLNYEEIAINKYKLQLEQLNE